MAAADGEPMRLPPGVYFNPTPEECVTDYLRPWIEGQDMRGTRGVVVGHNIYGHSPDEFRRMFPPGHSRGSEQRWYFLSHFARQGGGRGKGGGGRRASRGVATGGLWQVEQKARDLDAGGDRVEAGYRRRTYGFYLGGMGKAARGNKSAWLMEEFTREEDDGGGKKKRAGPVPVFCKLYVSPRASGDERRGVFGEDAVPVSRDGKKKKKTVVRIVLSDRYFDSLAELLPASCLREVHRAAPPQPGEVLGHQHGQFAAAPPAALGYHRGQELPSPGVHVHQHGHAVLLQGGLGHYNGMAMPPEQLNFLDPYHPQGASPGFLGHYNAQDAAFYHQPAPALLLDPQQGEEVFHMEKKARLTYGSSAPESQGMDGGAMTMHEFDVYTCQEPGIVMMTKYHDNDQCWHANAADTAFLQEPEPVPAPAPTPLQESTGTVTTASSHAPADDALPPLPPELHFDSCQAAGESFHGGSVDFPGLTQLPFGDDAPDFGTMCEFQQLFDSEPLPPPDWDLFSLEEFFNDGPPSGGGTDAGK